MVVQAMLNNDWKTAEEAAEKAREALKEQGVSCVRTKSTGRLE